MKFNGEVGNFGIYSEKVVNNIREMREPFRFFVSSVKWVGFNSSTLMSNMIKDFKESLHINMVNLYHCI